MAVDNVADWILGGLTAVLFLISIGIALRDLIDK
jgi:hypothetical protein